MAKVNVGASVNRRKILIPVSLSLNDGSFFSSYVHDALFPSRVSIVSVVDDNNIYSINHIRNLALSKCDSTHVVFSLPTLIPSRIPRFSLLSTEHLYASLMSLPTSILDDPTQAIIIPRFHMEYMSLPCDTWYNCESKFVMGMR